jgi:hypothetical protein
MFEATLNEVPLSIDLDTYKKLKVPVLDQGQEGACTGFGLATVANYLLRKRATFPDINAVSARMFYQMAKRYDEWPGEDYSGSSARGAMKGWYKHGVCSDKCWPYKINENDTRLTEARTSDALQRPLGAYYRVNHKDLIAMHSAMAEVGILYATATVHEGWSNVGRDGIITLTDKILGGHAFAVVAYDERGFWIQNSWGKGWGNSGFGLISYDDWLLNASDVWVARLGAPVKLAKTTSIAISHSAAAEKSDAYSYSDLRPHLISIGNDGLLNQGGDYGTSPDEVKSIFEEDFPRVTKDWKKKRLLLYAHGGLVSEKAAVQRLADYRSALLKAEVYPISFIWHSDAWSTLTDVLQDALNKRKPEGFLDSAKDFLLDRLDDTLEPIARIATGKLQWDEMKENALMATQQQQGGARLALQHIKNLAIEYGNKLEIHVVGHSAGSIFHAPLIQLLTTAGKITTGPVKGEQGMGLPIASCTLWAPACTVDLFKEAYLPAINSGAIGRFALFTLTDDAERDDHCAHIYHKSLLYLVSNAFESKLRLPMQADGIPIVGMQKFVQKDPDLKKLFKPGGRADHILAPNTEAKGSVSRSTCSSHGGFDDDEATVNATLGRILQNNEQVSGFTFKRSAASLKEQREVLFRQ